MASLSLINKVKGSPILYSLYYRIGSFLINTIKIFLKSDENLILFVSYGGKKYDDTPKDVFEAMINDPRFDKYEKVWAFRAPEKYSMDACRIIKIDSWDYYKTALRARVWITNVGITRALDFKGIHTLSINSWHGTAIKKIGGDAIKEGNFVSKEKNPLADIMLAQGQYDVEVYSRAFNVPKQNVVITGFPRNDSLVTCNNPITINKIRKDLNIPSGKKVILYAPTYRDYDVDSGHGCVMKPPFDLDNWEKKLSKDYILLVRAHIAVMKVLNLKENDFIRDVSKYPYLNEILIISDVLISDYSGILFDYSILGRPMLCYTYDYEKYKEKRGVYIDIRKDLTYAEKDEQLLDMIQNMDWDIETKKAIAFREKFIQQYGNASQKVLDIVYENIKAPSK